MKYVVVPEEVKKVKFINLSGFMSFWEGFIQNVALGLTMEYRVHWNWQARINFFYGGGMGLFHPYLLRK